MKVAVFGSTGMLGHMVVNYLSRNTDWEITALARQPELSKAIHKQKNVEHRQYDTLSCLDSIPYDYTINCVGILGDIHRSYDNIRQAIFWNAEFVHFLAINENFGKIINISTDAVFSGKSGQYKEYDKHDGGTVYAMTKSLAEINSPNLMTLRCSIIGQEAYNKKKLLEWFLARKDRIVGYKNHFWNGITTLQYAKICEIIIKNKLSFQVVQHIIPKDVVSKYELLNIFKDIYQKDIEIISGKHSEFIDRSLMTAYPDYNKKFWDGKIVSIRDMVKELFEYNRNSFV